MDTNRIKAASRHFARRRATSLPPSPARLIAGALARCWAALAHRVRRWSAVVTPTSSENHVLTIVLINSAYFIFVRGGAHTIVYIPALDDNVHGNRFNNVMTMYNVHGMCIHPSGQRTLAPPAAHRRAAIHNVWRRWQPGSDDGAADSTSSTGYYYVYMPAGTSNSSTPRREEETTSRGDPQVAATCVSTIPQKRRPTDSQVGQAD